MKEDDIRVKTPPLLEINQDWVGLLRSEFLEEEHETMKSHERTGRPLGSKAFIEQLEKISSRILKKQKPGSKKNN